MFFGSDSVRDLMICTCNTISILSYGFDTPTFTLAFCRATNVTLGCFWVTSGKARWAMPRMHMTLHSGCTSILWDADSSGSASCHVVVELRGFPLCDFADCHLWNKSTSWTNELYFLRVLLSKAHLGNNCVRFVGILLLRWGSSAMNSVFLQVHVSAFNQLLSNALT
jgi:hypothetical protein